MKDLPPADVEVWTRRQPPHGETTNVCLTDVYGRLRVAATGDNRHCYRRRTPPVVLGDGALYTG
ncbi:hypothetical protein JNB11_04570 [Kocuria palustris]|nr:hypothetical protein [Kocuria palustris]